ncbi:MAG: polysaccharide deacetylase family protein [Ruminococcaceae bacterium]|nr:polysaccharide deacetylase family protein [Oscillospiraceae bacterium]
MLTYTVSKKKLLRMAVIALSVLVIAGIIIMAVMSSMKVSAADKKLPIYAVSRSDNKIALTFDCAWGNSNTDLLLGLLKDAGAKATFFVTGEFCDKYPEDVKKMYNAGHEIGNHSDLHPHVEGMNINALIEDTRKCSQKIKMITGEEPKIYRAPYGEYDNNVVTTIEGMGMKMIQWSVDSIDWKEPEPETIIKRIEKDTVSGSILLFHNDLENTSLALPQLLTDLKQKGFVFSTVSDTVYYDSYHIDHSGLQIFDVTALLPTVKYSDNELLNETMEIFRQNLTLEEIYALTEGATPELLERTAPLLDDTHKAAVEAASFEELREAVQNLITVAEREGAGDNAGDNLGDNQGDNPGNNDGNQDPSAGNNDPQDPGNNDTPVNPDPDGNGEPPAETTAPQIVSPGIDYFATTTPDRDPADKDGMVNSGAGSAANTAAVTTEPPVTTTEETTVPETTPAETSAAEKISPIWQK